MVEGFHYQSVIDKGRWINTAPYSTNIGNRAGKLVRFLNDGKCVACDEPSQGEIWWCKLHVEHTSRLSDAPAKRWAFFLNPLLFRIVNDEIRQRS